MTLGLIVGIQVVVAGVVLFFLTPAIRRRWPNADGFVALARTGAIVIGIALLAISVSGGQTPMSNTPNPIPNQVSSVDAGYDLYQANCAACHGVAGEGGGPLAGTTQVRPPSLKAHLAQHTDGDLFYWIGNGLPGGMPAFSSRLSEIDRWNVVNYLRSINGIGPTPHPSPAAVAADRLALLFPIGWAVVLGSWLVAGIRRSRARRP